MDSTLDKERCGIIVYNGGPGVLDHKKGIHRPDTKCPVGKWDGVVDPEQRLLTCRACRYYLAAGVELPDKF